jgi:hypothetical protein
MKNTRRKKGKNISTRLEGERPFAQGKQKYLSRI